METKKLRLTKEWRETVDPPAFRIYLFYGDDLVASWLDNELPQAIEAFNRFTPKPIYEILAEREV